MGKRGKAARKRRRENEVVDTAALASKLLKRSADAAGDDCSVADDAIAEASDAGCTAHAHGVTDAALETTVATLHVLSGLVDPATGKSALKDKRYRSLRRVLYEMQGGHGAGASALLSSSGGCCGSNNDRSNYIEASATKYAGDSPHLPRNVSTSSITREVSAMIESGSWELAATALRNVRGLQEEYRSRQSKIPDKAARAKSKESGDLYLRPKLGAVQRWVRQVDAAGTDDPSAVRVLDAVLRVVAPEAIVPVKDVDMHQATWERLGVKSSSSGDGGNLGGGSGIRRFPSFDRRPKNADVREADSASGVQSSGGRVERDIVDELVSSMESGEDGIRRIPTIASKGHCDALFRKCGYERGADRKPPNKYDLQLVTTSAFDEARSLECNPTCMSTFSKTHILLDNCKMPPVVMTPLPYVLDSFLLENVLSPTECDRMIASAETAGYRPDEPLAGQPGASTLAHACVWLVDRTIERAIFWRVREFLPSYGGEGGETLRPLGLNRRFRFYRYVPGRYYRPHIDGAWPPSGLDGEGNYQYDICDQGNRNGLQFVSRGKEGTGQIRFPGDSGDTPKRLEGKKEQVPLDAPGKSNECGARRQLSRLTFLIYLNDDFDAGQTTFLLPAKESEGVLNAFPVEPVRGGVLVFPHGTCAAPLHEGSPVLRRCKYVVRTEVEYYA